MKRLSSRLVSIFMLAALVASCAGNTTEQPKTSAAPLTPPKDEDKQWGMANKDY